MKNKGLIISGLLVLGLISYVYYKKKISVDNEVKPNNLTDFAELDNEDKLYPHAIMKSDYDKMQKKKAYEKKKKAYELKKRAYEKKKKAYELKLKELKK